MTTATKRRTKLRVPTQAQLVLDYLQSRGSITAATANSVLGIPRLAAVVLKMKDRGINIKTNMVPGLRGSYAEYALIDVA